MKKAQILSAIALAFALGVVAPISAVPAYAADEQANICTGTSEDLANAIKNVTDNPTYVAYEALAKAKADAATVATVADVKNGSIAVGSGLIHYINQFTGTTPASTKTIADLMGMIKNDIKVSVNGADRTFAQLKALVDAINDTTPSDADEVAAIKDAMTGLGFNADAVITNTTPGTQTFGIPAISGTGARGQAITALNGQLTAPMTYDDIYYLVDAYDLADVTNEAFGAYKDALLAGEIDLTNADKNTVRGYTTGNADFSDLNTIEGNVRGATNWANVRTKVAQAKALAVNDYSVTNICGILSKTTPAGLLQLMRTATDNADLTYAELVSAAPVIINPTDPTGPNDTDKPGDAEKPGDDTTPGNTGVVSSANGTASSTVAVVAGIATALTAAGAGVVAYRNARREA